MVADNAARERYEIEVDGRLAGFAEYRGGESTRAITHTEVEPELAGRGIGSDLIRGALDDVRERGLRLVPVCGFTRGFLAGHPEYTDLVDPPLRRAFSLPDPPAAARET
jgi:predicted GNAT family acetyltransferase